MRGQGVYGHGSLVRNGNTVIIVGGFHGTVTNQVIAYILPSTIISPEGKDFDRDEACRGHTTQVLILFFFLQLIY